MSFAIRNKEMQLQLYNTLTKAKEVFTPLDQSKIKMYVCGPTVYDYPHLGNALAVVIYDVLYRLLKHIYGDNEVVYVRNITDVDDKIINAAKQQNILIHELTETITKIFQNNMNQLNCLEPSFEPKATEHINEMIDMITKLIEYGYFRVHKFIQYGEVSGRNIDDLIAGARVEIAEAKESPEDFVLWKTTEEDLGSFDSPFGRGRPGWHIECSAMSGKYLGSDFDIHGGGIDLIFPHHTNEIAQSCCAYPGSKYARYWVHNGFLTVNGEKMSKSLGNFITIEQLLQNGVNGEVIRYVLLSSHYRKPIDWNDKALSDAKKALDSFYRVLQEVDEEVVVSQEILDDLLDDLNTPKAFAHMHEYAHEFNKTKDNKNANKLKAAGKFLGFFNYNCKDWFASEDVDHKYVESKIKERMIAKLAKNWQLADQIRNQLYEEGIILEDLADGSSNWRKI